MSEESVLSGRVEQATISLLASTEEAYDTQPIFRVVLDVSGSKSMGYLEQGYYVKVNEGVYFVRKKIIDVSTNSQTEKVLEFLKRTQAQFTIDIKNDKTLSGHQYIQVHDVDFNSVLYTLKNFRVFHSLWQIVEGELYENMYEPEITRFTESRLIWYLRLFPEHSLLFKQVGNISLEFAERQGHLQVFRIIKDEQFVFPGYLYSVRKHLKFFNHEINETVDVIPLGGERRIISLSKEVQITSSNHDPITLPQGQYLLFHPRPRRDGVD